MCRYTHRTCIRRSIELHIVIVLYLIVSSAWLSTYTSEEDNDVDYEYHPEYSESQERSQIKDTAEIGENDGSKEKHKISENGDEESQSNKKGENDKRGYESKTFYKRSRREKQIIEIVESDDEDESKEEGERREEVQSNDDDERNQEVEVILTKESINNYIKCIYLLILLLLGVFTRISHRSYKTILWSTIGYLVLLPIGLVTFWPTITLFAWVTVAFLGLFHLMNLLLFYIEILQAKQDALSKREFALSKLTNDASA